MPVQICYHFCYCFLFPSPAIVIALTATIFLAIPFQRYPALSSHHAPARWLIPNLIAEHSVNLIAGTSRTGKTVLALTMLDDWLTNGSALDYQAISFPSPIRPAALVLDRPVRELQRAITALACEALATPRSFPIVKMDQSILQAASKLSPGDSVPANAILQSVRAALPFSPTFLLIEGIDRLVSNHLSPLVVSKFLNECHDFCESWDCTILGTIGAVKQKLGEGYVCPIDMISGPPVWGSGVETSIILSLPESSFRLASQPVNLIRRFCIYAPSCAERLGYLRMTPQGRMELVEPDSSLPLMARAESMLSQRLDQAPQGKEFSREDFFSWGVEYDISQRSVERWIRSALELGLLLKLGSTRDVRYQKPVTQ